MLLEGVWEDSAADAITKELTHLGYSAIKPDVHNFLGWNIGPFFLWAISTWDPAAKIDNVFLRNGSGDQWTPSLPREPRRDPCAYRGG